MRTYDCESRFELERKKHLTSHEDWMIQMRKRSKATAEEAIRYDELDFVHGEEYPRKRNYRRLIQYS